ncbi:MAG: helix-turn-helix domain-containing protein [Eubacteriales bacterium]
MSEQEKMLTIKQASALIKGVSQYRIRKMCVSGELPTFKSGKKYLIHEKTLRRVILGEESHG